jgi:hypothetical protein
MCKHIITQNGIGNLYVENIKSFFRLEKCLLVVLALNSFPINVFVNVLDLLDYFSMHPIKMRYIVE